MIVRILSDKDFGCLVRRKSRRSLDEDPRRYEDGFKVCHMLLGRCNAVCDFRIWKGIHNVVEQELESTGACLAPRDAW